jgi:transcriptional regulator with XRE-family HTH domain
VDVDPSSSPLAYFVAEVKRLRDLAGMTQERLAGLASFSPSTIAALESYRLLPSADLAEGLDRALNGDGHLIRLQGLVEKTSVLPWFRDLVKVERSANEIRMYEPYQIPALLQTEDYTRAIARANRPMLSDSDIDQAVALRRTRQEIFDHNEMPALSTELKPRLWAIMDEPALYRLVGSPDVMRGQCEYLLSVARKPNITIQIIPNSQGATCAFGRAFEVMVVKHDSIIYVEDIGSARYIRKTDEAARYLMTFDYLRASALDEDGTIKMIEDAAR